MRVALLGPVQTARLRPHLDHEGDLPLGQGGTAVTLLAEGLLDAGHDVEVYTLDRRAARPVHARGAHLRVHVLPMRESGRGRDAYRSERRHLAAALESNEADVLHAHWSYEYALAALATGRPTVVTVRDWAPSVVRLLPMPYWVVKLLMNVAVLAQRPVLTTPSPYMAARLRRWSPERVEVIPNGVPDDLVAAASRSGPTGNVVLSVSDGFGGIKNTATLMDAHSALRRRRGDAELVLVGAGHGPDGDAQRWARAHGREEGVRFLGRVPHDEVLQLMRSADVLVHPSREESFGNVLVEAMAQGLPVVGGRRSGAVPWVLDGGRAGALVDIEDATAIADACLALLDDPARWAAASAAGVACVRRRFRLSVVVRRYVSVYESVLAQHVENGRQASTSRRRRKARRARV